MVSAAGFEPTAPGFIPLRLSPPPPRDGTAICAEAFVVWTVPSPWAAAFAGAGRRRPSSLYTVRGRRRGLARDRHGASGRSVPRL